MEQAFDYQAFWQALNPEKIRLVGGVTPPGRLPELSEQQLRALAQHAAMVVEANRKFNLTAITDPAEMAVKHYLDSLSCCLAVDFAAVKSVCDVGAGAGFPGVPLAICFAQTDFTLVESNHKKAAFLERVVEELGLRNSRVIAERAETVGRGTLRESFDVVVSRGVADLAVLAEFCLPLVRVGGSFLAMRGKRGEDELSDSKQVFVILGGGRLSSVRLDIEGAGERVLIIVRKESPTPDKYPRRPGVPEKRPLR